jgi:Leucine-rich repeat (LRR) protein
LINNYLESLPDSIGDLPKLDELYLSENKLRALPQNIFNIRFVHIRSNGYQINNLDPECEFIIINSLGDPLTNLPMGLKELWLDSPLVELDQIKIPFGCKIYVNGKLKN